MNLSLVVVFFTALMMLSASISEIRGKQSVAEGLRDTHHVGYVEIISNLYMKFNSFDTGIELINGYGAGTAGYTPYIGSLFFFVPRFIYLDKPIAGSIDNTYYGTPARLVPRLNNPNDTINNVGVSPLAISIWHWGWVGGIFAFFLGGITSLRLLDYLLSSNSLVLITFGISIIPIPGFLHVFPSPDVALKHVSLAGFIVLAMMIGRRIFGKRLRRRAVEYYDASRMLVHPLKMQ